MKIARERFADGMALQLARFHQAGSRNTPRIGWKVGLNVPEIQRRLDIPHSAVGWLDGRNAFPSNRSIPVPSEARIHVEAEVGIRIGCVVPAAATARTAETCIECVHPALELVDYSQNATNLREILGHSMFHFASIVGEAHPLSAASRLGEVWPRLTVGGRPVGAARRDLVPRDLGSLVAFVANYLAEFGESLEKGDVILSGAFSAQACPLPLGETAVGEFGPLGSVSASLRVADA